MLNYQVTEIDQQAESLDERVIEIARVAQGGEGWPPFPIPCDADHG